MVILTHKKFDKAFKKVPAKIKQKFYGCVEIFLQDEFDVRLRNHVLAGQYSGSRSIDITGDWRVLYERVSREAIMLTNIGTHSQLHG